MLEIIALLSLIGSLIILYILSIIDLRDRLLPNELVMGFMCLGLIFHLSTLLHYISFIDMALGAVIGGGILFLIRSVANAFYKEDTLGLGDVKLLGAAGIWLGPEAILIAMTIGAFLGFLHGMMVALRTVSNSKVGMDLTKLAIPAGPGFALGIVMTGALHFRDIFQVLWPS